MISINRDGILVQKETPLTGRKPEDAIFGGVPTSYYIINYIGLFVKVF
jgi:hypothetical protein